MQSNDAAKPTASPTDLISRQNLEGLTTFEAIEVIFKELRDADNDPNRAGDTMKPVEAMMKFRRMTARNFR